MAIFLSWTEAQETANKLAVLTKELWSCPYHSICLLCISLRNPWDIQHASWVPYLFVYIANTIRPTTAEQERALITFLRNMEEHLIEKEVIQAVGFRYVGSV